MSEIYLGQGPPNETFTTTWPKGTPRDPRPERYAFEGDDTQTRTITQFSACSCSSLQNVGKDPVINQFVQHQQPSVDANRNAEAQRASGIRFQQVFESQARKDGQTPPVRKRSKQVQDIDPKDLIDDEAVHNYSENELFPPEPVIDEGGADEDDPLPNETTGTNGANNIGTQRCIASCESLFRAMPDFTPNGRNVETIIASVQVALGEGRRQNQDRKATPGWPKFVKEPGL